MKLEWSWHKGDLSKIPGFQFSKTEKAFSRLHIQHTYHSLVPKLSYKPEVNSTTLPNQQTKLDSKITQAHKKSRQANFQKTHTNPTRNGYNLIVYQVPLGHNKNYVEIYG